MTVLILTNTHDPTADDVIMRLRDRGTPVFRLDPADFPQRGRPALRDQRRRLVGNARHRAPHP